MRESTQTFSATYLCSFRLFHSILDYIPNANAVFPKGNFIPTKVNKGLRIEYADMACSTAQKLAKHDEQLRMMKLFRKIVMMTILSPKGRESL